MTQRTAFSPITVWWLIAVGLASFGGAAYFSLFGDGKVSRPVGANAYSNSAIGHRAIVETLRRLDIPVLVSRSGSAMKAGRSGLLVIAEPHARVDSDETIDDSLTAATILFVLPKWVGRPDGDRPQWLGAVKLRQRARVEAILRQVVSDGYIRRFSDPVSWRQGSLDVVPTLAAPQLVVSRLLTPIVASDEGMLVGELVRGSQRIWILSDPDLLSNSGLGRGDNAVLAVRLIEALRPAGGAVIIDESVHGFRQDLNLSRAIFEFPFIAPTILAIAALAALMWAATGRFGAAIPSAPALSAGKTALIDSMAGLLRYGGHGPRLLRRYAGTTLRSVAKQLHAPRNLDDDALVDWVDRVGEARGVSMSYGTLLSETERIAGDRRADSPRLARAAGRIHRWKQEIVRGS